MNNKIKLGILGGGDVASHLIDYASEYPMFVVQRVLVQDLTKPRFFDRYQIEKTTDLESIVAAADIDVVVDCLPGIDVPKEAMIKALTNKKVVVSCGKQVWNTPTAADEIIATANEYDTMVWLNAIVANRQNDDLVIPVELTHKTIKDFPARDLYVNRHAEGVQTALFMLKDLFKIFASLPHNLISLDTEGLAAKYGDKFYQVEDFLYVIEDLLPEQEIEQLTVITNNITEEQIRQYQLYKQYEKFKAYCEEFLNRTDYKNVLIEGVVHGGLNNFAAAEAIPVPIEIAYNINDTVRQYFQGPFLMKDFNEIQFLPLLEGVSHMKEHLDIMNNIYAAFGAVYYLNDDFEGGELHFPVKNFKFKAKKNSLVIFKANDKQYVHGVDPVTAGKRYAIPSFVWLHLYPKE